MSSKESGDTEDKELLDRFRRASAGRASVPNDAVRAAILAESRRIAEELQKTGAKDRFDTTRPAANDSRWKITAFGTLGAALLAALVIAPRYWETLPASRPQPLPQVVQPTGPAPKAESAAPAAASNSVQDVVVINTKRRAPDAEAQIAAKPAPVPPKDASNLAAPTPAPSAEVSPPTPVAQSTNNRLGASADRMFNRTQSPLTLQSAAHSGDVLLAAKLLDQGAAVNVRDDHGRTPLMLAVEQGHLEVVRLLLKRGADSNATDDTGQTPLQKAKLQNLTEIQTLLEDAGGR